MHIHVIIIYYTLREFRYVQCNFVKSISKTKSMIILFESRQVHVHVSIIQTWEAFSLLCCVVLKYM